MLDRIGMPQWRRKACRILAAQGDRRHSLEYDRSRVEVSVQRHRGRLRQPALCDVHPASTDARPPDGHKENGNEIDNGVISRQGALIFFSNIDISPNGQGQVMSSFSMRAEGGGNQSLLRGQPTIPDDCREPRHWTLFRTLHMRIARASSHGAGRHLRMRVLDHPTTRHQRCWAPLFRGLSDYLGYLQSRQADLGEFTTTGRDIYYFGNCDLGETIKFRLHERREGASVVSETSLARKSDGTLMAYIISTKSPKNSL